MKRSREETPSQLKKSILDNPSLFASEGQSLQGDKVFVQALLKIDGAQLEHVSDDLKNDEPTVEIAIRNDPQALKFSEKFRSDKDFILRRNGRSARVMDNITRYIDLELQRDHEFMLKLVNKVYHKPLQHADESLKNSSAFMQDAARKKQQALEYASDDLKNDFVFFQKVLPIVYTGHYRVNDPTPYFNLEGLGYNQKDSLTEQRANIRTILNAHGSILLNLYKRLKVLLPGNKGEIGNTLSELITEEEIRIAAKSDPWGALKFCEIHFENLFIKINHDLAILLLAMSKNNIPSNAFEYVNLAKLELGDAKRVMALFLQNCSLPAGGLCEIPKKYRTILWLQRIAVIWCPSSIEYVLSLLNPAEEDKKFELCFTALMNDNSRRDADFISKLSPNLTQALKKCTVTQFIAFMAYVLPMFDKENQLARVLKDLWELDKEKSDTRQLSCEQFIFTAKASNSEVQLGQFYQPMLINCLKLRDASHIGDLANVIASILTVNPQLTEPLLRTTMRCFKGSQDTKVCYMKLLTEKIAREFPECIQWLTKTGLGVDKETEIGIWQSFASSHHLKVSYATELMLKTIPTPTNKELEIKIGQSLWASLRSFKISDVSQLLKVMPDAFTQLSERRPDSAYNLGTNTALYTSILRRLPTLMVLLLGNNKPSEDEAVKNRWFPLPIELVHRIMSEYDKLQGVANIGKPAVTMADSGGAASLAEASTTTRRRLT